MAWKIALVLFATAAWFAESFYPWSSPPVIIPASQNGVKKKKSMVRQAPALVSVIVDDRGRVAVGDVPFIGEEVEPKTDGRLTMAGCGKWANKEPEECTHISEQYFVDVRCCGADDAVVSSETYGCHRQKSFAEATQICNQFKLHVCSAIALRTQAHCGQGCKLDKTRVWSSTPCVARPVPLIPAPREITEYATTTAACGRPEYIEQHAPKCEKVSSKMNVRCCLPGSRRERMKKYLDSCDDAKDVTFEEAKTLCHERGLIICSKSALLESSRKGLCGMGCGFDKLRVWSSDWCAPDGVEPTQPASPKDEATVVAPGGADDHQPDTQGCLIKEADGKTVWIEHRDGTFNWVSNHKIGDTDQVKCWDKAAVVPAEHVAELTMRKPPHTLSDTYKLDDRASQLACYNDPCEPDTQGCLVKTEPEGLIFIAHADGTRNWIDMPSTSCAKATVVLEDRLSKVSKRHRGVIDNDEMHYEENYVHHHYNLRGKDATVACENPACAIESVSPMLSKLLFTPASLAEGTGASEDQRARQMRVRSGPEFKVETAGNHTGSKDASN